MILETKMFSLTKNILTNVFVNEYISLNDDMHIPTMTNFNFFHLLRKVDGCIFKMFVIQHFTIYCSVVLETTLSMHFSLYILSFV